MGCLILLDWLGPHKVAAKSVFCCKPHCQNTTLCGCGPTNYFVTPNSSWGWQWQWLWQCAPWQVKARLVNPLTVGHGAAILYRGVVCCHDSNNITIVNRLLVENYLEMFEQEQFQSSSSYHSIICLYYPHQMTSKKIVVSGDFAIPF